MNFDLEDRFCDSKDLEMTWKSMEIPKPLLKFFSVLFNFDMSAYTNLSKNKDEGHSNISQDAEQSAVNDEGSLQKICTQIQGLTQTLFYITHHGKKRAPMQIMTSH